MTSTPAPLDPHALIAGPRGRRLCLELAGIAAQVASADPNQCEFGLARFYAAYNLDPGRGQSVVMVGLETDDELPSPSPEEAAALLDLVPLPELTESGLLTALTATVDSARYWQEPDGDDVLAATPEMRRALHRFAQALAVSPLTQWWRAPVDPCEQWTVEFILDLPRPPAEPKTAALTLEQWRTGTLDEERRAATDRPSDATANFGGTWWSRPPWELAKSTREIPGHGPLGLHLVEDRFDEEAAVTGKLNVPDGGRIFEINSPADWAQLCRTHPLDVTASRRHDWYRTTGRIGSWVLPDWSALQESYDGVHLTMGGYLATAGCEIPVDATFSTVLAGWAPDATYWLSDVASDPAPRQSWLQDQEGPAWTLQGTRQRSMTTPARSDWSWGHGDYRGQSETAMLGTGEDLWQRACADVLRWKVKTRSGFTVDTSGPVVEGQRVNVTARVLGIKVLEPVEVVTVVDAPDRVGFSYRTLPGHPVSGEEAFIVHRLGDDVYLTIRSLTRAAPQQPWRTLIPGLQVAQKLVRRRYLRALR